MISKNLSIKDRYNFRGLKFDDEMELKPKKTESIRKILGAKSLVRSPCSIIKYGLKNEVSARTMEKDNTLIFICEVESTKPEIKQAIEKLYGAKVAKVNTLIMFKQYSKKAFVKFAKEGDAVEVATKAGIL
jgi:large subunit ribosomal protein L23Ae